MSKFEIASCTVDDSAAIARNNVSAFWTDSNWVLLWPEKSLEYVISQAMLRSPCNLLKDPARRRHQKAVDVVSGALVGYARWILPEQDDTRSYELMWANARVPAVDENRIRQFELDFERADWKYDESTSPLDVAVNAVKLPLLKDKKYMMLDYLAVHPDHAGQGIATLLVEGGLREAQKMGFDVFVHAFKAGLGVYQRCGFNLLDKVIQDDSAYGGSGEWGVYFLEFRVNSQDHR